METKEEKIFYIAYRKEFADIDILAKKIEQQGWVDDNTSIVVIAPAYSSIMAQTINHRLSNINNELLPMLFMEFPTVEEMSQVWNPEEGSYQMYEGYARSWVIKNIRSNQKYLILASYFDKEKEYHILNKMLKSRLPIDQVRLACLYKPSTIEMSQEQYVQDYDGKIIFEWENVNIK